MSGAPFKRSLSGSFDFSKHECGLPHPFPALGKGWEQDHPTSAGGLPRPGFETLNSKLFSTVAGGDHLFLLDRKPRMSGEPADSTLCQMEPLLARELTPLRSLLITHRWRARVANRKAGVGGSGLLVPRCSSQCLQHQFAAQSSSQRHDAGA